MDVAFLVVSVEQPRSESSDSLVDHVGETTCAHDVGETGKYLQPVCFCWCVGETAKYLQPACFCWFVGETAKYLQPTATAREALPSKGETLSDLLKKSRKPFTIEAEPTLL